MKIRVLSHNLSLIGLLAAVAAGCENGATDVESVVLVSSPSVIEISEKTPSQQLFLSTSPAGKLDWKVTSKPDWVSISPLEGTIRKNVMEVTVSADFSWAEPGTYYGKIELISNGGAASVNVMGTVIPNPIAEASPAGLVFTDGQDTTSVTLRNAGKGMLSWSISPSNGWMTVSETSGHLSSGQSVTIQASVDLGILPVGTTSGSLTVKSNARAGDLHVPVSVTVPAAPIPVVSRSQLKFGATVDQVEFFLFNRGRGTLNWSAAPEQSWISASPATGALSVGDSVRITASVNRAGLPAESMGTLVIRSDAKIGDVPIAVIVSASSVGPGLRVLDHRVVDAEYSLATDQLVTVSTNPSRLNIIDPDLGTVQSVLLPQAPTSVSIRPDGTYAAVGHDRFVSYINLRTRTVERVYRITTDAVDVVLAGNGWVYAFPRTDQWEFIRSVNLQTSKEEMGATVYAGTVGKLHPSGDFIYGATNGTYPSNFEKYSIRGGVAGNYSRSPYHGDLSFDGDIWISEDGGRLFARSGNVFRASPVQAEDMQHAGKLSGVSLAKWVVDSRRAGRVFALSLGTDSPATPATEIRVYDIAFLASKGMVPLPKGTTPAAVKFDYEGQFVFANSDGTRLYALVRAAPGAGLAQDWALVIWNMSAVP